MPEFEWQFTLVLLTNGIMIGLMYALIALGFVLIYKATDAINFAQGEFVMFAGFLAAVSAEIAGMPFWLSSLLAIGGMVALGFGLERVVLRPLIGRPVIAVVMATIGLAAVLRGTAVMAFGAWGAHACQAVKIRAACDCDNFQDTPNTTACANGNTLMVNWVTMPKLPPPPPLQAQYKSALDVADACRAWAWLLTTVICRSVSQVRPCDLASSP